MGGAFARSREKGDSVNDAMAVQQAYITYGIRRGIFRPRDVLQALGEQYRQTQQQQ